jgi:integrase
MRVKLNKRNISALAVGPKRYEVTDEENTKFRLRVSPSGIKTYVLVYRNEENRLSRYTIGRHGVITPEQAREVANRKLAELTLGDDPALKRREARQKAAMPTLGEFLDDTYLPWFQANYRGRSASSTFRQFSGLYRKPLDKLTTWDLEKWRKAKLDDGTSPGTVNRYLSALKAAYNRAIGWGVVTSNPVTPIKPFREDIRGKVRYLSTAEEKRLREALAKRQDTKQARRESANRWRRERGREALPAHEHYSDHLAPIVLLAMNTGMRRGELFNLAWQDVDLRRRLLTVAGQTAKSGLTRHIPLNAEAQDVLKQWKAQQADLSGYVFPGRNGGRLDNIKKGWDALLTEAKIAGFRFHDLRHHFASRLVMAGVDLNTVRELLGHSDITMTLRYAHLAPEHKADAVAKLVELR